MAPSESMAYTGKIRGMKEEGCQSSLENFCEIVHRSNVKARKTLEHRFLRPLNSNMSSEVI